MCPLPQTHTSCVSLLLHRLIASPCFARLPLDVTALLIVNLSCLSYCDEVFLCGQVFISGVLHGGGIVINDGSKWIRKM